MVEGEILNSKDARARMASERPNHRGRGRTQSEIRKVYEEYNKRKRLAFEAMGRSKSHLVLYLASDGDNPNTTKKFYNLGGDSAVIYAYDIAPRIGKKDVILRPDLDGTSIKFKYVTSIANLPVLTEKLKEIGVNRVPSKSGDQVVYFDLKQKYDKDQIHALLQAHRDEVAELNKILFTGVVFPDIHVLILDIREAVYHKIMKMNRADREVLESEILKPVFRLADLNALIQHGDIELAEGGKEMIKAIDILYDRVKMVEGLDLWELSSCARVGKMAAGLRNLVVGKIVNKGKDEANK